MFNKFTYANFPELVKAGPFFLANSHELEKLECPKLERIMLSSLANIERLMYLNVPKTVAGRTVARIKKVVESNNSRLNENKKVELTSKDLAQCDRKARLFAREFEAIRRFFERIFQQDRGKDF